MYTNGRIAEKSRDSVRDHDHLLAFFSNVVRLAVKSAQIARDLARCHVDVNHAMERLHVSQAHLDLAWP